MRKINDLHLKWCWVLLCLFSVYFSQGQCIVNPGNDVTICNGESIQLGGSPTVSGNSANVTYDWTNNGVADVANPTVSPSSTTTYTLVVNGGNCNNVTETVQVTVIPSPVASFSFSPNNQCAGTTVNFTSNVTNCSGCTYSWDFGNPASGSSNIASTANASHAFVSNGGGTQTFNVSLTVTAANGCDQVVTQTVTVLQSPVAALTEDVNFTQCLGAPVFEAFVTNTSTPASNTNYTINWGDGSPNYNSSTPPSSFQHNYNGIDIWTLTYTVTGTNGCVDVQTYEVTNISNPSVGTANPGNTLQCGPVEFCFAITNTANNYTTTTYTVNFGDGSTPVVLNHPPPPSICHTYTTSACGGSPNYYTFSITADNNCTPSTANFFPIQIGTAPSTLFSAPAAACVNSSVPFTNQSIPGFNLGCNGGITYQWNFGDPASGANNTSTAANPTHVFAQPGTYTVTLTAGNAGSSVLSCGTDVYTQTICIEQPPAPSFTVPNNAGCVPFNVNTNNTSSTSFASCNTPYAWQVFYTPQVCPPNLGTFSYLNGTNASSTNPQFLLSNPGTYTIQLQQQNSCGLFTDTETIVVNTAPTVTLSSLPIICAGSSVSPSAAVNGCNLSVTNYAWSFPGGTPSSFVGANPGAVTYPTAGNYTITLTVTNACGTSTASTSVSVLSPPNIAISSSSGNAICANTSTILTASNATSYSWSPSTGLSSTSGSSVTAAPASTTTYTVTGFNGTCSDTETFTVIVNPLPQVVASGIFSMCVGETEQMGVTVSGGLPPYNNYLWNNASSLNNATISNPISTATSSLNYNVTVTDFNGCIGSGVIPLTVNPLPIVNAGADQTLCNQPVATSLTGFSPSTGGTGTWSGVGVTTSGVFTPSAVGCVNLTYTFTSTTTGCTNSDIVQVCVVNPTPANGGPDFNECLSSTAVSLPSGGTWSGPNVASNMFTPSSVGTFTLNFTVGNGSCQTSDQVQVTVLPLPTANAGADISGLCAQQTVTMSGSGTSPNGPIQTISWSGSCGGIVGGNTFTPTITPSVGSCTYNMTVVDSEGCNAQDQVTITVNALPIVNAGLDLNLCNQPIATNLTGFTPTGGTWSVPTGINLAGNAITPTSTGTFVLTYTYTSPVTNCTNTDQISVTVSNPVLANAGPDISVCLNSPAFTINPITPGGTWSPNPLVSSTGTFNPNVVGSNTLTYTIGAGTCQTSDQINVTVNGLPQVNFGANQTICLNDSVQINGVITGGQAPYSILWNFPTTLSNANGQSVFAFPSVTTNYLITVTDNNNCVGTDNVIVTVNSLPIVEAGNNLVLCDQPIVENLTGFSPTIGGSGTWTGAGIINADGQFQSPGVGTYWLYYEFTAGGNACTNRDSIQVTVNSPVIANAGPDVVLCLNDPLHTFSPINPSSGGIWSGSGILNPNNAVFNAVSAGVGSHVITLTFGTGTCLTSDQTTVQVLPLPVVSAGSNQTVCGNLPEFTMSGFIPSTGGTWEGNGILSSTTGLFDPAVGAGVYNIFYWFTDPLTGCSDTSNKSITVSPVPTASFILAPLGCTNASAQIDNTSTGASIYEWDFGNGIILNGFEPSYTYPDEGFFDIQLVASNSFGCSDTAIAVNEIIDPPFADIDVLPNEGCAPLNVSFLNNSIGQYLTYNWDLSVSTSNLETPNPQVYIQGDSVLVYPISLTVSNFCGTEIDTEEVTVNPQPVASFGTNLDVFCSPFTVEFNNTSVGEPDTFEWDFGDGSANVFVEEPLTHVFTTDTVPTNYTIFLYLSNECGLDTAHYTITVLPNTVTSFFNTNITEGCSPLEVEFTDFSEGGNQISYHFGDNTFTGEANPVHVFDEEGIYTVYQYVDNGCSYDTSLIVIEVFASPELSFGMDDNSLCANEPFTFVPQYDDAVSLFWDFGDGNTSALSSPEHSYVLPGNYTVSLTGVSDNLCTTSISDNIQVIASPNASFSLPDPVGCSPFNACFANATVDGLFYQWDFGDGNSDNDENACNTYINVSGQPLAYTVTLVVQNLQLCSDTMTMDIVVSPQPVSAFTLTSTESCSVPIWIETSNSSQFANGFDWQIDNVTIADETNTGFELNETGEYEISLTASNQFGCSSETSVVYEVHERPQAEMSILPAQGCVPLTVEFLNTSNGAYSYAWNFGDGSDISPAEEPLHVYTNPGNYDVSLIVTSSEGCTDTISAQNGVNAFANPIAAFSMYPEETTIYDPLILFINDSWGAETAEWRFGDGNVSFFFNAENLYETGGAFDVSLIVESGPGCRDTTTRTLVIQDIFNVFVPNTFTPDQDGINEYFHPKLTGFSLIERYTFRVFDRWGTTLFETNDPELPWIGDIRGGNGYAKDDIYNWQVKVQLKGSDKEREYHGHVILVR